MTAICSVSGLSKSFGFKPALSGLELTVEPGKVVGLMGPNGAGKTTLLRILAGLLSADEGELLICGERISPSTRKWTSIASDHPMLMPWMRVQDALAYYSDMFSDFDERRANDLCNYFQVDKRSLVRQLSFGEQQRASIMLCLARKARLYLIDEPFNGIDPLAKDQVLKSILQTVSEDCSLVISTHQVKDVEAAIDEVIFLDRGKVLLQQSAEMIRSERGLSVEECYLREYSHE